MSRTNAHRRILSSAWLLAAVALGACDDSTSPPRPLTPEELESFGFAIASEVETGLSSMVASDLLGSVENPGGMVAARPRLDRANLAAVTKPECATTPQDPILDADNDNIPNDVVFTFARPACEFDFLGSLIAVTGSIRLVDALPQTAGFGYSATLNDFTVSIIDPEFGTITAGRDGTMSVAVSPTQLTLSQNIRLDVAAPDVPATSVTSLVGATFVPAAGSALVAGQPLPDGVFTPSSTVTIDQAGQNVVFTLSAPTPLQYSAACVTAQEISAFTAGEVRATISGPHGNGYVRVRWLDCGEPDVVFVAATPA